MMSFDNNAFVAQVDYDLTDKYPEVNDEFIPTEDVARRLFPLLEPELGLEPEPQGCDGGWEEDFETLYRFYTTSTDGKSAGKSPRCCLFHTRLCGLTECFLFSAAAKWPGVEQWTRRDWQDKVRRIVKTYRKKAAKNVKKGKTLPQETDYRELMYARFVETYGIDPRSGAGAVRAPNQKALSRTVSPATRKESARAVAQDKSSKRTASPCIAAPPALAAMTRTLDGVREC